MRPWAKPRSLRAFALALVVALGSTAGTLATSVQVQAAAKGTIEICKSASNGMTGRSFSFTISGVGGSVSVVGGGCSAPISVTGGNHVVTEAATGTTVVQSITLSPAGRKVSLDVAKGTVTVRAPAGQTETVVTYVNKTTAAQLTICKQAASNSTQLIGEPFSFSINGGAAFTIDAGRYGSPRCSALTTYAAGTKVSVQELTPAPNVSVSAIAVTQPPASNVATNLSARTASLTLGSGVNAVTFTNEIVVAPQPGYIEVCKQGADQFVSGYFFFSIVDAAGLSYGPYSVLVGQCTSAIQVTPGTATITESAQFPYALDEVYTYPTSRFVSDNLINQTARVTVVAGNTNTETVATFVNETNLGLVKVCKTLDSANSDALAGSTFTFDYSDAAGAGSTNIVANTFENGPACVFLPTPNGAGLPLGSSVTITEDTPASVSLVGVSVSPSGGDDGSTDTTAKLTVQPGITSATFTNQAEGTIEICKDAADPQTLGDGSNPFNFTVNGSINVTVDAGKCSTAIVVPAGTATVLEGPSANFSLVSVTATGPALDNRIISGTNPVTVDVPFGGGANETLVTFTNAVNTGQFQICKVTSLSGSLIGSDTFTFTWSYTVDNTTYTGSVGLEPGQCSDLSADIPDVDSSGNPVLVSVTETPTADVAVASITYSGNGSLDASDTGAGTSSFYDGLGINTITYDNEVVLPTLSISTDTYDCTPDVCWGTVTGSGLFPDASITFSSDSGGLGSGVIGSDGTFSAPLDIPCGDGFTGVYASTSDFDGNPISSIHVDSACG
jgi:hypothetical protein